MVNLEHIFLKRGRRVKVRLENLQKFILFGENSPRVDYRPIMSMFSNPRGLSNTVSFPASFNIQMWKFVSILYATYIHYPYPTTGPYQSWGSHQYHSPNHCPQKSDASQDEEKKILFTIRNRRSQICSFPTVYNTWECSSPDFRGG